MLSSHPLLVPPPQVSELEAVYEGLKLDMESLMLQVGFKGFRAEVFRVQGYTHAQALMLYIQLSILPPSNACE